MFQEEKHSHLCLVLLKGSRNVKEKNVTISFSHKRLLVSLKKQFQQSSGERNKFKKTQKTEGEKMKTALKRFMLKGSR